MEHIGVSRTGRVERVSTENRVPDFDPRTGNHFWIIAISFAIRDPEKFRQMGEQFLLDHENIVQVTPLVCVYCARPYSQREKLRRCTNTIPD